MYVQLLYGKYSNFSVVTISLVFSAIISAVNFSLTLCVTERGDLCREHQKEHDYDQVEFTAKIAVLQQPVPVFALPLDLRPLRFALFHHLWA